MPTSCLMYVITVTDSNTDEEIECFEVALPKEDVTRFREQYAAAAATPAHPSITVASALKGEAPAINAAQPLCAHYFVKNGSAFLDITEGPSLSGPHQIRVPVTGKREARRVAAQYNAKPWNF
jgi:hypothetical protein